MADNQNRSRSKGSEKKTEKKSEKSGTRVRSSSIMDSKESSRSSCPASPGRSHSVNRSKELTKVTILGAGGGIGQPLAMLLMLHTEYVQHVAMHDLIDSIHGVGLDVSHIDRRCKITTHLGSDALVDAVRGAKIVIIPAGLAQKPGMSRDDLFGTNAKILYNLVKVCAQVVPNAMIMIITNPVNSLVPIACEVYSHFACSNQSKDTPKPASASQDGANKADTVTAEQQPPANANKSTRSEGASGGKLKFQDCFRRIFGVTTLDVVRSSTLTAKSTFFKSHPNGLFMDPNCVKVPVVGGHAGKTIMPLLSQAVPKLDRKRLVEDKATTMTLVDSIQQAGIEVLNAKRGRGSATMAMAYSACRFALSLLRAMAGEQNVIECAYVHQPTPVLGDLEYFATPLVLGKDGFTSSLGIPGHPSNPTNSSDNQLLPFEMQMIEEGVRELRSSIAKGEDFGREQLHSDK